MDSAQLPSPQIGRILIAAGLLSEAQLAQALEEQRETGRRLGEIIVRRGFISGPALANALAEQHGGLLKTEYGFATGLGGDVAQKAATEAAADPGSAAPMPLLRTAEPAPVTPIRPAETFTEPEPEPEPERAIEPESAPLVASVSGPQPEPDPPVEAAPQPQFAVALPPSDPEPVVESSPHPQFAFAPPAREPEPAASEEPTPQFAMRVPDPEPTPALDPPPAVDPGPESQRAVAAVPAEPAAPESVAVEPEAAVPVRDDRDDLIESLRARIDAQDAELAQLRTQVEQLRAASQVQVHVQPQDEPAPVAPTAPARQQERYLVCVPTAAGYVLLDRIGAVPAVGDSVDVPEEEGSFTVTKVVRLPRNGRPCAYLQRV